MGLVGRFRGLVRLSKVIIKLIDENKKDDHKK